MLVPVAEAHEGCILITDDGERCLILRRWPGPHGWMPRLEMRLRLLRNGRIREVRYACNQSVEVERLPERELCYLYRHDIGHVFLDPVSLEEFTTSELLGPPEVYSVQPGQRVMAGFWKAQPLCFRPIVEKR
jgi:translation elongation factor P/translation initiation factor 5A